MIKEKHCRSLSDYRFGNTIEQFDLNLLWFVTSNIAGKWIHLNDLVSFSLNSFPLTFLVEAVLSSTHNLSFGQKYEKYQTLYLKTFSFWW